MGRFGGRLNNVRNSWRKLLQDADSENLRWQDLRHYFASRLVMAGVDLYTVAKLLGHSSVAVTQMYAHLAPDYLKVSIERLQF